MGNNSSQKSNKKISCQESNQTDVQINPSTGDHEVSGPKKALNESDFEFLVQQTNLSKTAIQDIFDMFIKNNPDAKLDRKEFIRIYDELRPEPAHLLVRLNPFQSNSSNCIIILFFTFL